MHRGRDEGRQASRQGQREIGKGKEGEGEKRGRGRREIFRERYSISGKLREDQWQKGGGMESVN